MNLRNVVLAVVLLLLIFFLGSFIFSGVFQAREFESEFENVLFVSDYAEPIGFLKAVPGGFNDFAVSPEFSEVGSTSFMSQGLTLFNSVLVAKGKKVETIARVVDFEQQLLYCQVNDGNVLENQRIEAPDCSEKLESFPGLVFFIELPDAALSKSSVEVSEGRVYLRPRSFEEVARVSFLVLSIIYPDAGAVIDSMNRVLDRVQ
ncbi:MAG: hypothetical protein HY392_01295 [Candidatus Diapherotrites archaeon]|nr:hypothetical protein [Candidatus Diapherotrites archaeon]